MTEFSVLMLLQGTKPRNSWLRGISLKDYKIIWKIKVREMKTKTVLRDFNCTMDKTDRDGGLTGNNY